MNITYDEFMEMQVERLSKRKNVIEVERLQGINKQINQFKIHYKKYVEILTITLNLPLDS